MANPYKKLIRKLGFDIISEAINHYVSETDMIWAEIPVEERIDLIKMYIENKNA